MVNEANCTNAVTDAAPNAGRQQMYAAIAHHFARNNIAAFLWRDREAFPSLVGFDMDVLVAPRSWKAASRALGEVAASHGWRNEFRVHRGAVHTWILRGEGDPFDDRNSLQVDLHRALTVSGLPYIDWEPLAAGRSESKDGVGFLSAVDGAVISCLEPMLAGSTPKPRYVTAFKEAEARDPTRLRALLRASIGALADTFRPGEPREGLWRAMALRALALRPAAVAATLWWKLLDSVRSYLFPPGMMMALSGPDGVGKSAAISVLVTSAPRRAALEVTVLHSRPFLIPRLAVFLPKKEREKVLNTRVYEANLSPFKSWVRAAILVLDCNLGYWLKVRPKLARGHLVIFDRYVMDILVDPRLRGFALPDSVLRALSRLVPQPLLSVVLVAAPETIVARKQELSCAEATQQVEAYSTLAAETRAAMLVRNDNLTPKEVAAQIVNRLWDLRRAGRQARGYA